jgi:entericidin B
MGALRGHWNHCGIAAFLLKDPGFGIRLQEVPMVRFSIPVLTVFAFVLLSACETIKGAGQDVENAGQAITDTAEEADNN